MKPGGNEYGSGRTEGGNHLTSIDHSKSAHSIFYYTINRNKDILHYLKRMVTLYLRMSFEVFTLNEAMPGVTGRAKVH